METKEKTFVSTRNACKLCSPLGASVAFKGVKGCVPLIHGSQGCSTYIRRYLISHYKEPVDIASTNFTEESAVFGGERNLYTAIENISKQYKPEIICIATTCLSETIGDDMQKMIKHYKEIHKTSDIPELVFVNSPSYKGTHADAFHHAVLSLLKEYAAFEGSSNKINLFPGFISPADIRQIKNIVKDFGMETILLPDYSDTLDSGYSGDYVRIPEGGTSITDIRATGSSMATIEFGYIQNRTGSFKLSPGSFLENEYFVPNFSLGTPIGIRETDRFFEVMKKLSGMEIPEQYSRERARLIDAYVDGHKYVFGKKAVVYGEEDMVVAMISFLEEIGIETIICATGGQSGLLKEIIKEKIRPGKDIKVMDGADFEDIAAECKGLKPDILIGNSKGYYIARELDIPIVRTGFPVHDRLGGNRMKSLAYTGTQELFDRIANALIEKMQDTSPVGYKYM